MKNSLSLRIKLIFAVATVLSVMSTGLTVFKLVQVEEEREDALNQHAKRLGEALAAAVSTPIWEYDADAVMPTLEGLKEDRDFVEATIIDDNGRLFCQVRQKWSGDEADYIKHSKPVLAAPSTGRGGQQIGVVHLTFSRERLKALRRQSITTDFLALLVLLIAMVGVVSLTIRAFTRPIVDMTDLMERREHGDYDAEVAQDYTERADEIGAIARSLERDQKRRREEVHMLDLTNVIARELELDILLPQIAATATQLLGAQRSSIFLYDGTQDVLWSRVAEGMDGKMLTLATDEGIAGAVFSTGERINIPDVSKDPRFSKRVDDMTGFETRDILCEPLVHQDGACIGVIQVLNRDLGDSAERGERLLEAFAAQTVVAIDKARLFRDVLVMKNYNESILNSLNDGVISMQEDLTITKVNPAALRILGLSDVQAILGQPLSVIESGDGWLHRSLDRVKRSGQPDATLDRELTLASGEQVSVNASTLELKDEDGETSGFMLILSDISAEKRVRSTMARYMPKEVIEQLLRSEQRALVGAAQVVTTLFSDIRGFTTISEAIGATATVALLNEYFTEMIEVLESHHGILDKYIGDAVMAIFGAPFTGAQDADNAVRAANAMILALEALNERRAARGEARLDIGVGLNTGEVVLGNIGSPKRMDYTVIGDPVNLAARLEGVTKLYGARIVLSQFTYEQLKERAGIRELDLIRVKGKTEPVAIYESFAYKLGEVDEAFHQSIDEYNTGLAAYRAQAWAQSQAHFTNALALNPQDKASSLYLERIASYDAQMPADSWDGVFNLDTK